LNDLKSFASAIGLIERVVAADGLEPSLYAF
jgi:hypothetical protein